MFTIRAAARIAFLAETGWTFARLEEMGIISYPELYQILIDLVVTE